MPEVDNKKFYVARYRLDGQDRYLLWWTSDETDAVWANTAGQIPVFEFEADVLKLAEQQGVVVEEEEPSLQNLDVANRWLKDITRPIDCEACLTAWNFFLDAAQGTNRRFVGQRDSKRSVWRGRIYDKLFFGTSTGMLLASPSTPAYYPTWDRSERIFIAKVLKQGMKIFRDHVYQAT